MEMPGNIEKELDEGLQDLVMLWPEKKDENVFFFICRSPPFDSFLSLYSSSNFDSKGPLIFIQTPLALKGIDIASRMFLFFLIFCLYVDALHDSLDKLWLFLKKLFLKWLPKLRLFVDLFFNKLSYFVFRSKMFLVDLLLLHPHTITMIEFHLNLRLSKTLSYLIWSLLLWIILMLSKILIYFSWNNQMKKFCFLEGFRQNFTSSCDRPHLPRTTPISIDVFHSSSNTGTFDIAPPPSNSSSRNRTYRLSASDPTTHFSLFL